MDNNKISNFEPIDSLSVGFGDANDRMKEEELLPFENESPELVLQYY